MAVLTITWSPADNCFIARSMGCSLRARWKLCQRPGKFGFVIPRDKALQICQTLHDEGTRLVWIESVKDLEALDDLS